MFLFSPSHPAAPGNSPSRRIESSLRAKQSQELETLRQRGLAKLLNQHFTERTRRLATEKAAADAALRDLEQRKAATSEFSPSYMAELSQIDALRVSVNQWRADCRRKEKETLLLYQRYVDKFAGSGLVQVPESNVGTGGGGVTPQTKTKQGAVATPPTASTMFSATPTSTTCEDQTPVPNMAAAIENTLEDYYGSVQLPSISNLGVDATYASEHEKEIQEFRNYYRQQQMELLMGKEEVTSSTSRLQSTPEDHEVEFMVSNNHHNHQQDDNVVGTVAATNSFLQSIEDVATTPQATGKSQQKSTAANDASPPLMKTTSPDTLEEATEDGEQELEDDDCFGPINFLQRHDSDSDSVVSGLTINSALTRRIIDDCERKVITFFHEEQAYVRRQLELEEEEGELNGAVSTSCSFHGSTTNMSDVQSVQLQAAIQAEHMARQMRDILEKFEQQQQQAENESVQTSSKHKKNNNNGSQNHVNRPYPTNNPNEEWMVLYDESFQREYYHETKSGKTQWEPPLDVVVEDDDDDVMTRMSVTSRNTTSVLSHAEVKPQVLQSRAVSRMQLYRRKCRRQRKRRMMAAAVLAAFASVLLGTLWILPNSALSQRVLIPMRNVVFKQKIKTKEQLEKEAREEANRLRLLEEERIQRERLEAAERKKRQEVERKRQEEANRLRLKQEAEREAELRRQQEEESSRRPAVCNIPFAYVVDGKCRRLAAENPAYDLQDLVSSMMQ